MPKMATKAADNVFYKARMACRIVERPARQQRGNLGADGNRPHPAG